MVEERDEIDNLLSEIAELKRIIASNEQNYFKALSRMRLWFRKQWFLTYLINGEVMIPLTNDNEDSECIEDISFEEFLKKLHPYTDEELKKVLLPKSIQLLGGKEFNNIIATQRGVKHQKWYYDLIIHCVALDRLNKQLMEGGEVDG